MKRETPLPPTMSEFLYSGVFNGQGGADPVEAESTSTVAGESGPVWTHLDVHDEASRSWLENESGLDPLIVDTLLAEETRPRSFSTDKGLLVVLRGVNTNPGQDPEDMVSVRVWLERDRIISTRRRRLLSVMMVAISMI